MAPSPYTRAQLLVRYRAGQLSVEAAAQIERALRQYADRLGRMVRALPSDPASAAAVSRRAVLAMADDLHRQMQRAILNGRDLSYAQVQALWEDAGKRVATSMGTIPLAAVGGVAAPTLTLAGAYEMLGGAAQTWKTRLAGYARASAADADAIIRDALLTGAPQDKLATALRPYVTGAKDFHEAFGDKVFDQLKDLRASNVPADLRDAARKVKYQAERIAYSEIWNARAEASLAAFAADPMIEAVRWVLSPNRGEIRGADECDALADSDFYGLGPGVYPIAQVPYPPHPWCRCEREPVIRPPEQAGEPKPNPSLRLDPSKAKVAPEGVMVTAAQRDRVRERVGALLNASRAPAAQAATVAIMDQAAQSVVAQQMAAMAGRT